MLEIKLAIVMGGKMARRQRGGFGRIEISIEEVARIHELEIWSAGPPSRTKRRSQ